jgi:predicted aspartyl protease
MLAQQQQLNLTAHARCFITSVRVNGRRFIAMIDSGATGNFMARALVEKEGYSTQKKPDVYNLMIVDENPLLDENERVNKETKSLSIAI